MNLKELNKVKLTIADLEADLKSERANLRALTAEQNRVQRDKEDVLLQLQRTELVGVSMSQHIFTANLDPQDMDDVKKQLYKFKQQNHELETELRGEQHNVTELVI
jgi:hypothetical protein